MGLAFARRGYLVLNASYRLAPRHRYPAAAEDVFAAWTWAVQNAASWGGDPGRLLVAGESAGANLVAALAVATAWPRPEPWALPVWEAGVVPRAVVAACGMFQVSEAGRYRDGLPWFLADRIEDVADCYLPADGDHDLADPLLLLERAAAAPARPLPPFFLPVGTADPLIDDTRRMAAALGRLGARAEARYYDREIHAFHALIWRPAARRCWQDTFDFLRGVV
jgi:acetyl esterase